MWHRNKKNVSFSLITISIFGTLSVCYIQTFYRPMTCLIKMFETLVLSCYPWLHDLFDMSYSTTIVCRHCLRWRVFTRLSWNNNLRENDIWSFSHNVGAGFCFLIDRSTRQCMWPIFEAKSKFQNFCVFFSYI